VSNQTGDPKAVYATIRSEILDQKKCQFQIFSLAVTATALILAYAAGSKAIPVIYLAPMVMNTLVMIIIFDKAISIQRKVGYLQIMERNWETYIWMWETQLDRFRAEVPLAGKADPARKHGFVTTVGAMLMGLNLLAAWLGVMATAAEAEADKVSFLSQQTWPFLFIGAGLLLWGVQWLLYQRYQLIRGRHSGPAIRETWQKALAGDSSTGRHPVMAATAGK